MNKKTIFVSLLVALAILGLGAVDVISVAKAEEEQLADPGVAATTSAPTEVDDPLIVEQALTDVLIDEAVSPEDLDIEEPTLLPTSRFYFLKNWQRALQSALTFSPEKKASLQLRFSNERLLELRKMANSSTTPEKISRAIEKYQKTIEKIKEKADGIKDKQGDRASNFLDKYTKQQILQEKILDKLEQQVPTTTFEKIRAAREAHLIRFGEVMEKVAENKEQIKEKIQSAIEDIKGSDFSNFKMIEIINRLEEKAPLGVAEKIKEAKGTTIEKLQEKISNLSPEQQIRLKHYIQNTIGTSEGKLRTLEQIKERAQENKTDLKEQINTIKTNIQNRIEQRREQGGSIGGDKDKYGCLIAAGYQWCEEKQKCLRIWEEKCSSLGNKEKVCANLWNPVCGKDGNTYSNACYAGIAKVEVNFAGICPGSIESTDTTNPTKDAIQNIKNKIQQNLPARDK